MRPIESLVSKKEALKRFEAQRDYVDGEFVYGKFLFPNTEGRFDADKVRSQSYKKEEEDGDGQIELNFGD